MASERLPVTQQIGRSLQDVLREELYYLDLESVADCLLRDRAGTNVQFGDLYREKKAIIVFVRNFLCYTCKEYVEDLAKIPKSFLEDADVRLIVIGQASYVHIPNFCSLTGYPHEMYVDSEREIYNKLGMKRGETSTTPDSPGSRAGLPLSPAGHDMLPTAACHMTSVGLDAPANPVALRKELRVIGGTWYPNVLKPQSLSSVLATFTILCIV